MRTWVIVRLGVQKNTGRKELLRLKNRYWRKNFLGLGTRVRSTCLSN